MDNNLNNQKLANFLGWVQGSGDCYINCKPEKWYYVPQYLLPNPDYDNNEMSSSTMKFTTEWDWLMLVVEKIETLSHTKGRHYYLHKEASYVQLRADRTVHQPLGRWGTSGNCDTKMAIYRACVEFVEKYIETPMP